GLERRKRFGVGHQLIKVSLAQNSSDAGKMGTDQATGGGARDIDATEREHRNRRHLNRLLESLNTKRWSIDGFGRGGIDRPKGHVTDPSANRHSQLNERMGRGANKKAIAAQSMRDFGRKTANG